MVWDYAEANILSDIGWSGACEWVVKVIEHIASCGLTPGTTAVSSATSNPLPDGSADALVSDPPYYAAIPYADLSDFFYSWLRRSIGELHGDLFTPELTPKDEECVQLSHRAAMYRNKDATWFEVTMAKACAEGRRVTKSSGISSTVSATS
jgi:adenine-specific DNA methylase